MSKLRELIDKYCPNGVEYREVQTICRTNTPKGKVKSNNYLKEGKYPVIDQGQNFIGGYTNEEYSFPDGEYVIFGDHTCIVKYVNFAFVQGADGVKVLTSSDDVLTKYLYYCMSNIFMPVDYARHWSKMKVATIPIPPIEVQEEIVKILDRFAEYAAELQAELQARQEQYEYYRNKLLTFNEIGGGIQGVIWMKMSEIGTFIRGKRFVRTDIVNDGVPCIHYGDMYTYYGLYATKSKGMLRNELAPKMRYAQKNDVVIVAAGENKEDIGIGMAWLGDEPAAVHDACFIFKSDLYPQYVSHYLRTNYYHKQIVKHVSEGKICSISAKGLGSAIIPIPSYEEQVRIATLLNKFDELVSDLIQGLPAEIAAVQEQYEYYRDKLLSFPKYKLSA